MLFRSAHLPVVPPTPVRVVAAMLKEVAGLLMTEDLESDDDPLESDVEVGDEENKNPFVNPPQRVQRLAPILEHENESEGDETNIREMEDKANGDQNNPPIADQPAIRNRLHQAEESIRKAVKRLGESSLTTFIASNSILHSTSTLHSVTLEAALSIEPKTNNERILLAALRESADQLEYQKRRNLEIQATGILNATYCKSLAEKLAVKENAKSKPKKKRLMSDGLPVLLTDDFFYEKVVEFEAEAKRKEAEMKVKQQAKADKAKANNEWITERERRESENAKQREVYLESLKEWEEHKAQWAVDKAAKKVKGKFPLEKPKLGKLLSLTKPKGGWVQPQNEAEGSQSEAESSGEEVFNIESEDDGFISDSD